MDMHESFVGADAFRRGLPGPLCQPVPVRSELTIDARTERQRRAREAQYRGRVGYQFSWGQVEEERHLDLHRDAAPDAPAIEWHFVLSELHAEFLVVGGNLAELSDWCVMMLEAAEEAACEVTSQDALPGYLSFAEGNSLSAFSILVSGAENLAPAREWIADVFIPGMLPLVVESARHMNRRATAAAND